MQVDLAKRKREEDFEQEEEELLKQPEPEDLQRDEIESFIAQALMFNVSNFMCSATARSNVLNIRAYTCL